MHFSVLGDFKRQLNISIAGGVIFHELGCSRKQAIVWLIGAVARLQAAPLVIICPLVRAMDGRIPLVHANELTLVYI